MLYRKISMELPLLAALYSRITRFSAASRLKLEIKHGNFGCECHGIWEYPLRYLTVGHAVAQLVEALTYKLEGRGFDSRWCHWNFLLTLRRLISYIYMEHPFLMFLDHTQRRSTVGRTPVDEWSARRRDLYLTTHNTHNRQTTMPAVGFEPTISAGERSQTYASDRTATGTGITRTLYKFNSRYNEPDDGLIIPKYAASTCEIRM